MTNPIATPVSRGRFLDYPRYDHMGEEWKAERRREEAKQIFANFTTADQGRSRVLICTMSDFNTDAYANYLCLALNNFDDCVEALKKLSKPREYDHFEGCQCIICEAKRDARAVIARIEAEKGD